MSASKSNPVEELVFQVKAAGLREPEREYRFHDKRRWRFDLAFPTRVITCYPTPVAERTEGVAVEVDGGVYVQGRHSRGKGIEADMEKIATAMTMGWRVLRVTPRHIREGKALQWLEALLK